MINRVTLRGFVADEPFIRATERGKVAKLRLATIEHIAIRGGDIREHIEWHSVIVWGENADIADDRIRIGDSIEVEGALRTRDWEDKSGKMHRTTEISASTLLIIEGGIEGYKLPEAIVERIKSLYPQKKKPTPQYEVKAPEVDPDNLPF